MRNIAALAALGILLGALAGCNPVDPDLGIRFYSLVEVNGQEISADSDAVAVATFPFEGVSCEFQLDEGGSTIVLDGERYDMIIVLDIQCDGIEVDHWASALGSEKGYFSTRGNQLTMQFTSSEGFHINEASLDGDRLTIDGVVDASNLNSFRFPEFSVELLIPVQLEYLLTAED